MTSRRQILTLFGMAPALQVPLKGQSTGKRVDTLRAQVKATNKMHIGPETELSIGQLLGPGCSPFGLLPEHMGCAARKRFDADCVALLTCTAVDPSTNTITLT